MYHYTTSYIDIDYVIGDICGICYYDINCIYIDYTLVQTTKDNLKYRPQLWSEEMFF